MFDRNMVRIYNRMPNGIALPLREGRSVWVAGCENPERPVMETVTFSDLEYIHTHTGAIRYGMVEFNEEEEEIYEALHFVKWKESCFFERDIDSLLLTASLENMERIVSVQDVTLIDRIYAHLKRLIASGKADVSSRVEKVVEARRKELYSEIITSRIRLIPKTEEKQTELPVDTSAEVARLVAEQVEKQIALLRKETEKAEKAEKPEKPAVKAEVPKKRGRPAASATKTAAKKTAEKQ